MKLKSMALPALYGFILGVFITLALSNHYHMSSDGLYRLNTFTGAMWLNYDQELHRIPEK